MFEGLKESIDTYISESEYFKTLDGEEVEKKSQVIYDLFSDLEEKKYSIIVEDCYPVEDKELDIEDIVNMVNEYKNIPVQIGLKENEEVLDFPKTLEKYSFLDLVAFAEKWLIHPYDVNRSLKEYKEEKGWDLKILLRYKPSINRNRPLCNLCFSTKDNSIYAMNEFLGYSL